MASLSRIYEVGINKKTSSDDSGWSICARRRLNGLCFGFFFVDHHFTFVVKFSLEPVCTVEKVRLSSCWTCWYVRRLNFVVRSALGLSGLRNAVFGMCHFSLFLTVFTLLLQKTIGLLDLRSQGLWGLPTLWRVPQRCYTFLMRPVFPDCNLAAGDAHF